MKKDKIKKIDFLIIYEHKNREFESIALLKHELVRRGYTVEFFGFDEYHNKKKRKRLFNNVKIAVMPSLYHDEEILQFVYGVCGKVKNIVNLRWEQLFSNKTEKNLDYYVYPKGNAKLAYHCCWGQKPFEMLCEAGVDKDKLFITGPIHMDFLREDFRDYYLSKEKLFKDFDIDPEKRCVLFTSSFAVSSYNKWTLEWFFSEYEGEEKEYMKGYVPREVKSRDSIVEWIKKLADTKDCTIIYRPHPAEANTEQVEHLKSTNNIRVISDYNIKQWILACDQVYTWNSTSITEAYVAGIPCAVLRPIKLKHDDEYQIYRDITCVTEFNKLLDYFDSDSEKVSPICIDDNMLYSYISIDPNCPSYKRTADVLIQALNDNYFFPWGNFDQNELQRKYYGLFNDNLKDYLATILIKPFYRSKFMKRVYGKFFSKLYDRYCKMLRSKNPPISNEEFAQMEERIAMILSNNN